MSDTPLTELKFDEQPWSAAGSLEGLLQGAGMAALVRKASFGRKPHIRMSGAKVRALPTLARPTRPRPTKAPGAV